MNARPVTARAEGESAPRDRQPPIRPDAPASVDGDPFYIPRLVDITNGSRHRLSYGERVYQMPLRLPVRLAEQARAMAARRHVSFNRYVTDAVMLALAHHSALDAHVDPDMRSEHVRRTPT